MINEEAKTPQLLVSVRSAAEARLAIEGGADIVDVKDPSRGSLGWAGGDVLQEVMEVCRATQIPVTAALGELDELENLSGYFPVNDTSLRFFKVGFARQARLPDWFGRFLKLQQSLAETAELIPAAYADYSRVGGPGIEELLTLAIETRRPYFLIDTAIKDGRSLLNWCSASELSRIIERCHQHGIGLAIAGSLRLDDLPIVKELRPDVVAIRGAACTNDDRQSVLDPQRIRQWKVDLQDGS